MFIKPLQWFLRLGTIGATAGLCNTGGWAQPPFPIHRPAEGPQEHGSRDAGSHVIPHH